MSDNYLRIIPTEPTFVPDSGATTTAVAILRSWIPDADDVSATTHSDVAFIDPGSNLERVLCPSCGREMAMDAWREAMDAATESTFQDLKTVMACCGAETSLNDLEFELPAGFARFVLEAVNPNLADLNDKQQKELEGILGTPLRRIWAHY